ncbi:unnamed protein product [Rotaria sp. Silwood1]|nr:unnamed protein product [Rotaria sp. Silwood1]
MASAQFQVLSVLCRIVRNVVFDAVTELSENIFVSPRALPRTVFDTYTATLIDQFKKTTLENFRAYNRFISSIVDERRFISALRTNIYTRSVPGSNNYVTFSGIYLQKVNLTQSSFMSSETCRCDQTSNCIYPAGIYNQSKTIIPNEAFSNDASLVFVVPRFQVGCVPQNALLQSTLQCFYNQSCLDIVITLTGALLIGSKQIIVENPSMNQFEELYKMYSSILSCPSPRLSMPRSTFMHYEVQFHPFCTSSFVRDERWLQYWTMKFLNALQNNMEQIRFCDRDYSTK